MQIQAQSTAAEKPFADSRRYFQQFVDHLSSADTMRMTHGELERYMERDGFELLRLLFQDHLDLRGPGEAQSDVVGSDGVRRPHVRLLERQLKILFGTVVAGRMGYSAHDAETLFPRDAELNLPPSLYSHGVERRVANEVIKGSFDSAVESVAVTTGTTVPKRQAEETAARAAKDFDAFYANRSAESPRVVAQTGGILALTTDAKGIVMRVESLREGTRAAAENSQHKLAKHLSPGEKRNRKRMAQVAAVYTITPFVRRPEDVVRELRPKADDAPAPPRPRPENKRVWASVDKSADEVVSAMFVEAKLRDPSGTKQWVALVDGNPTQLKLIKQNARRLGVAVTIVLDLIHVLGYMWSASLAINGEGSAAAEQWVTKRLLALLRGESSSVAAAMRRSATLRRMTTKDRAAVDTCADYLLKYRAYLHYDCYLADGVPISSGVIEGACRHLIKDRMDITGARWSLAGAEAVLKLRSLRSSGDLDEYWTFHERADYVRNHADRYKAAPPATVLPLNLTRRGHLHAVN
jgi:hypothetical protein